MCKGAEKSYKIALDALKEQKKEGRVVLWGALLHNRDVLSELEEHGAVILDDQHKYDSYGSIRKNDTVIIRAHGEKEEFYKYLDEHGIDYKDGACGNVERIHRLISAKYREGYTIVIIGKGTHPEVTGSNGWCAGSAVIIESKDDMEKLPGGTDAKIFVVEQTTCARKDYDEYCALLKEKYKNSVLEIKDTICDAQENIQNSAAALAGECGTMIVIGDRGSSNTNVLKEKCKSVCPDTRLVESRACFLQDIFEPDTFNFDKDIGITGGASTPGYVIDDCKALLEFKRFYESVQIPVNGKIKEYNSLFKEGCGGILSRNIEQFIAINSSSKAKHIRAALIMLGYKITLSRNDADFNSCRRCASLAAAYEFFETSILIHDDIFDRAGARRGVQTIHSMNLQYYEAFRKNRNISIEELRHTGEAAAVCMGDLGFYFVNKMLLGAYKDDKNLHRILDYFNEVVITTIKGELLDVILPLEEQLQIPHDDPIEDLINRIYTMKTAEYTIAGPLGLGMISGGADEAQLDRMREVSLLLGVTYQIQDDMMNIFGTREQGKPVASDIAEYKMTLLYAMMRKAGNAGGVSLKKGFFKYYGKALSADELESFKDILKQSGVSDKINKMIISNYRRCRAMLNEIDFIKPADREILTGFIIYLELRSR